MNKKEGVEKLGQFLREVSNWQWDDFCKAENDPSYTTNESLIFALVRACSMEKMEAIKIALNRIDGKLKTPIKVEMPKVFFTYPNAKIEDTRVQNDKQLPYNNSVEVVKLVETKEEPEEGPDLPSLTLRQTLTTMADYPRSLPQGVIDLALQTEQSMNPKSGVARPPEIPAVKSVVAAHLLTLAQRRNIDALAEVFDQIDGKLAETFQIIGEDIYIINYSLTAPEGAYLNKDGVPQIEATQAQDIWAQKLGGQHRN